NGNLHWTYNTDGKIYMGVWNGGQCSVFPTVGAWNHVVSTYDGTTIKCYLNGSLISSASATLNLSSTAFKIAQVQISEAYFNGSIDEIRISNIARTADEIRQAYEVNLRTHPVQIDFGASLVSGNLITGSGDTSFSIDATVYGLSSLGSEIYPEEKIIVKENYDGTEYLAQGTVATVNASTGAVTVSSWDTGSTFPSGGYTVNADVFKWQKEYIPIKNRTVGTHVDAVNLLTFRITNGDQGRNIWIDDLRSSSGYLSAYTGEELTFPSSGRYFQYKAIFSTWDIAVTPYISQVQLDYFSGPTLDLLMRHGKWFNSSGVKQPFWWVGTH
ncbi:MAG TPA: LamG domain-containing protein, partial [Candidatus Dojkabacteria bacterium]|nr:LamG domain-containing protein [Candidatus Dojkabacteria bacterium]